MKITRKKVDHQEEGWTETRSTSLTKKEKHASDPECLLRRGPTEICSSRVDGYLVRPWLSELAAAQ